MHTAVLAGLIGGVATTLFLALLYFRMQKKPARCVFCGLPSRFGYSMQAESAKRDIASVCLNCLQSKLAAEYEKFEARALVIEPAQAFPCYVFQPNKKWKDCTLSEETETLLSNMKPDCHRCGARANFLWVTANGLRGENADMLFAQGIGETLLRWGNDSASSLCWRCCVDLIFQSIENRQLAFLEVCGPRSENGFVLPMGY
jgi:hypothetical protein